MQNAFGILALAIVVQACGSSEREKSPKDAVPPASTPQSQPDTAAGSGDAGSTGKGGETPSPAKTPTAGSTSTAGSIGSSSGRGGAGVPAPAATAGMAGATKPMMPCATPEEEKFSFFLISHAALTRESGSSKGFGGNLGGISGADALCSKVALSTSPCASSKTWRAFLSTTSEHAIDRIGTGPWYDRVGRVFANKREDLLADRPTSADPAIIDDFPNEAGVPNRNPDGMGNVDNHQILTGSGIDGKLYTQPVETMPPAAGRGGGMGGRGGMPPGPGGGAFGSSTSCDGGWTPEKATCWNWTSVDPAGCPRVGHSWPRQGSGINWISVWNEGGCAPGGALDDRTAPDGMSVGSFGGYGGFYCFAVQP